MKRPEPIPPNVDAGLAKARAEADVVCILDDGAGRCGMGDENGAFVDQLRVYALLAMYLLEMPREAQAHHPSRSARPPCSTSSANGTACPSYTGVKPKYIAPAMVEHDGLIGNEESGGYAFRGRAGRDGILGNLYLLDLLCRTGKKPTELLTMLFDMVGGPHYYDRIDTRLTDNALKQAARERLDRAQPARLPG